MLLLLRLLLAGLGGAGVYYSFEPHGYWPLGIVGITVLFVSLMPWRGNFVSAKSGALIGFVHSMVAYLLLLPWIGELVGAFPYGALAFWLSLYALLLGVFGVFIARMRLGYIIFPLFYLAIELLRSSAPFGGFSWVRLGWGQVDGPLAFLASWGGPALVTAAAATVGTSIAALLFGPPRQLVAPETVDENPLVRLGMRTEAESGAYGVRALALFTGLIPFGLAFMAQQGVNQPHHTTDTINIAAIQGNVPRLGLEFNAQRRAVLENHVDVTKQLAESGEDVDIVIWPENSSDVNPFRDRQAGALIQEAVDDIQVPIMVGTLTVDEVGERNTMQVFNADGEPGDYHYKKYLQPFGETMPMRDIFKHVSDYVELAGDFKPGDGPGVVNMADVVVGVATCYEVSFDNAFRTSIENGAQILTSPTNNATFGFSDMTYQQLAMSRMRAIETDRAMVVPATSGVSAIVHPDGTVSQNTEIFEPDYLVEELPLRDSVTFAVRFGWWIQLILIALGVVGAGYAWMIKRQPRNVKTAKPAQAEA